MQMTRLEILHQVSSLLCTRLRYTPRNEVRDDVVRLDNCEDELRDLANCRYPASYESVEVLYDIIERN